MNSDWAPAVAMSVIFVAMASVFVLRGPFGRALAERLVGRAGAGVSPEADPMLAEMDQLKHRLADVEERLDFAERLLAKQREAERLAAPR